MFIRQTETSILAAAAGVVACVFLRMATAASAQDGGGADPIVPMERRDLFPDHHALIAAPEDPVGWLPDSRLTDWARSPDATRLALQDVLPALDGVEESRAAAGRLLDQAYDQAAVAWFSGETTLRVDVLTPDGTLGPAAGAEVAGVLRTSTLVGAYAPDSFAIATGELNEATDSEGIAHWEAVLCYPRSNRTVAVTVLDYTDLAGQGVVQTTAVSAGKLFVGDLDFAGDSSIACATADLNGDGRNEVVLTYPAASDTLSVRVLQYRTEPGAPPTLQPVGDGLSLATDSPQGWGSSVDIAVGDFNVDGYEDVAVSWVQMDITPTFVESRPRVTIVSGDPDFTLSAEGSYVGSEVGLTSFQDYVYRRGAYECLSGAAAACDFMRVTIVSGLFSFDPAAGFDFNRRQLALVYNMPSGSGGGLRVEALAISSDLRSLSPIGDTVVVAQQACAGGACHSGQRFSVAAGGFVGSANVSNPRWSLVIGNWETTGYGTAASESAGQFRLAWLQSSADDGGLELAWDTVLLAGDAVDGPVAARLPVVAWDRDAASVYLGAPVRFNVYDVVRTDYVVQEPPKHSYWSPSTATEAGDGEIIDVSRKQQFAVELVDEQGSDYSFSDRSQTDWGIGASTALSASQSVTVGRSGALVGAKVTGKVAVDAKIGYDYSENVDAYESGYVSEQRTFRGATSGDDFVVAQLRGFEVWRYPVSGIELDDGLNPFWEISFPASTITVQAGGLSFDWYAPGHENGNILSYPPLSNFSFDPADCCAEFTFVGDQGDVVTEAVPFLDDRLLSYDGTDTSVNLKFSEKTGSGKTKSYQNTLSESLDVQIGYKAVVKGFVGKTTTEVGVDVNLSNTNSWSNIETAAASTSTSTGFKITTPAGNTNQSYLFAPVFYLARDGTTKVAHGVDILGTRVSFWPQTYGRKPDPALMLPRRFSGTKPGRPDTFVWIVNPSDDAKRIRGFLVRYDTLDVANAAYPLIAGAVTEGERLRIEVDVRNYSTGQRVTDLDVAFEAVAYDAVTNSELGDRIPLECGAGSLTSGIGLDPLGRATAVCVWETNGFGPGVPGALQDYRVYVILDPNDTVDEIYEGTDGPGQNNEGWGLVAIAAPQSTALASTPTANAPLRADVHLVRGGLAMEVNGRFETEQAVVVEQERVPLRVCVETDHTLTADHHVLIWRGDLSAGGELIADKHLPGVQPGGTSCVWVPDYRVQGTGTFELRAQVLETNEDSQRGNASASLEVTSLPIPVAGVLAATGKASRVGLPRGAVSIAAHFAKTAHPFDLASAVLVVDRILYEEAGAGELVADLGEESGQPLVLYARNVDEGRAVFTTPPGVRPRVQLTMELDGGTLRVALEVDGAEILRPALCGTSTMLLTELVVLDDTNEPERLEISAPWTCERNRKDEIVGLEMTSTPSRRIPIRSRGSTRLSQSD